MNYRLLKFSAWTATGVALWRLAQDWQARQTAEAQVRHDLARHANPPFTEPLDDPLCTRTDPGVAGVACPACGADAGEPCRDLDDQLRAQETVGTGHEDTPGVLPVGADLPASEIISLGDPAPGQELPSGGLDDHAEQVGANAPEDESHPLPGRDDAANTATPPQVGQPDPWNSAMVPSTDNETDPWGVPEPGPEHPDGREDTEGEHGSREA